MQWQEVMTNKSKVYHRLASQPLLTDLMVK
jgi:hypothetical protein